MKDILFRLFLLVCIVNFSCVSNGPRELNSKPFSKTIDPILDRLIIHKSDLNLKGKVKSKINGGSSNFETDPKSSSVKNELDCFKSITGLKEYNLDNKDDFEYFEFNKAGYVVNQVYGPCEFGNITTYDYEGNLLTKITEMNPDGAITSEMNFIYDNENRLIEFDLPRRGKSTIEEGKAYIRYGNNFLTFCFVEKSHNNSLDTVFMVFDKNNNVIKPNSEIENHFNIDSNLVKSVSSSQEYLMIEYDQFGNKRREEKYDSLNALIKSEQYEYDSEGKLLTYTTLDMTGYTMVKRNAYGNVIESTRVRDSQSLYNIYTTLNYYDTNNNIIQRTEIEKDQNNELEINKMYFDNKYDKIGNLIGRMNPKIDTVHTNWGESIQYYK